VRVGLCDGGGEWRQPGSFAVLGVSATSGPGRGLTSMAIAGDIGMIGRWTIGRRGDALLAFAAVAVSLLISAAQGFLKLAQPGTDNDSVMRLVQVRDLIAGQGWLDLHQYRMGLEGGFLMHWSRLVD